VTKLIQNTEKNRNKFSLKDPDTEVLCRKDSATRIPGKDHWHQTAVTTFTENGPFQ
jgi:hypothetical protein